jgi:hypothetical protein
MEKIMMKSAIVLLGFLSISAWATPDIHEKITFKVKNVTADQVFNKLEKQHDVKFNIDPKLKFTKPLSIDVKQASLKDILDFIVADQNMKWTAGEGNSIEITPTK